MNKKEYSFWAAVLISHKQCLELTDRFPLNSHYQGKKHIPNCKKNYNFSCKLECVLYPRWLLSLNRSISSSHCLGLINTAAQKEYSIFSSPLYHPIWWKYFRFRRPVVLEILTNPTFERVLSLLMSSFDWKLIADWSFVSFHQSLKEYIK